LSLKGKIKSGLFWTTVDAVSLNISRIIITIILARLLEPKDFGILGMLNVFMALSDILTQGGFIQTLIRKEKITETDYSTAFIFNLFMSVLIYLILFFSAPSIASFYKEPQLLLIIKVTALSIVFNAIGIIQYIILTRELAFKTLTKINLYSTILGGVLGIITAYFGYGVWSLVIQILSKSLVMSFLYWVFGNWKLSLIYSNNNLKENLNFGSKILFSNIISSVMDNLYYIIIGKAYSSIALGNYYQARKLSDLPSRIISQIFQKVSFPVLSGIQGEEERLKSVYLRFNRMIYFVSFPIMILLIIIAEPLVLNILGDKWTSVVPYFQILCIGGIFYPSLSSNGWITIVRGKPKLFFVLEMFYKIQVLIVIIITYQISVKAMVIGFVTQLVIQWLFNIYWASRLLNIHIKTQFQDFIQPLFIIIVTSILVQLFSLLNMNVYLLIIIKILLFFSIYISINYALKSQELLEIQDTLLKIWKNKNK